MMFHTNLYSSGYKSDIVCHLECKDPKLTRAQILQKENLRAKNKSQKSAKNPKKCQHFLPQIMNHSVKNLAKFM
jgi:hypothetical protein